jgi:hypothetical protein
LGAIPHCPHIEPPAGGAKEPVHDWDHSNTQQKQGADLQGGLYLGQTAPAADVDGGQLE